MALTVTGGKKRRVGDKVHATYNAAFDSSYPTAGEALPASGPGSGWDGDEVEQVYVHADATHFYLYDKVADKLVAWTSGAEVANTTDLSAKASVKCIVVTRK